MKLTTTARNDGKQSHHFLTEADSSRIQVSIFSRAIGHHYVRECATQTVDNVDAQHNNWIDINCHYQ